MGFTDKTTTNDELYLFTQDDAAMMLNTSSSLATTNDSVSTLETKANIITLTANEYDSTNTAGATYSQIEYIDNLTNIPVFKFVSSSEQHVQRIINNKTNTIPSNTFNVTFNVLVSGSGALTDSTTIFSCKSKFIEKGISVDNVFGTEYSCSIDVTEYNTIYTGSIESVIISGSYVNDNYFVIDIARKYNDINEDLADYSYLVSTELTFV